MNEHEVLSLMKWLNSIDNKELKELLKNIKFGIEIEINLPDIDERINVPGVMRYLADITSEIENEPNEDCISEYIWSYADREIEEFVDRCIDDFDEFEAQHDCRNSYHDQMMKEVNDCIEEEINERIDICIENKKEELLNAGYEEDEIDEDALYDECEKKYMGRKWIIEDDCIEKVKEEYKNVIKTCIEEARSNWEDDCYHEKKEDFINYDLSDILFDLYYDDAYEYCGGSNFSYETIEKLEDIKDKFHEIIESLFSPVEYDGGDYHGSSKPYSDSYYLFKFERDGSLPKNSFEFICPPLTYKEILKKIPKLVEQLDKDIHIDVDAGHGWHIHVSEENEEKYQAIRNYLEKIDTNSAKYSQLVYAIILANLLTSVSFIEEARTRLPHSKSIKKYLLSYLRGLSLKRRYSIDDIIQRAKEITKDENSKYDVISFYDSYTDVLNNSDTTFFDWTAETDIFSRILHGSHFIELRLVSKHKGIENRAPGGKGIIEVVKTPKEFKKILMDSLWRYYVIMNFMKITEIITLKELKEAYTHVFPEDIDTVIENKNVRIGLRDKQYAEVKEHKTGKIIKVFYKKGVIQ